MTRELPIKPAAVTTYRQQDWRTTRKRAAGMALQGVALGSLALLTLGCAHMTPVSAPAETVTGASLRGTVKGGQQAISAATITFYAASTSGYAGANTNILTSAVATDSNGNFNITGLYTCTAGQMMYLVSSGGNTGSGLNPQAVLMAALGDCAGLSSATTINLNEVTTVASAFALAPFMSGYANLGSSSKNTAGLKGAFNSVNKLANISSGGAGGPLLAAGATAPVAEINTIANIISACVNSIGGTAGDNSSCGKLFTYTKPSGGSAATDTLSLALDIALSPAQSVASIFPYSTSTAPFQPSLSSAPADFTLAISYPGFSSPSSATVDSSGQIWIANSTGNNVTVLNQSGTTVATLSGNGLNAPVAVAIDSAGNAWVANSGSTTVSAFTSAFATFGSSPFTVGTGPNALTFDSTGNLWVSNSGSSSISELSSTGSPGQTVTGITAPNALAVDPK